MTKDFTLILSNQQKSVSKMNVFKQVTKKMGAISPALGVRSLFIGKKSAKTIFLFCLLFVGTASQALAQRFAVASGDWNSTSTWSDVSGGAAGASAPTATDLVTIPPSVSVTVTSAAVARKVTVQGNDTNQGMLNITTGSLTLAALAGDYSCLVINGGVVNNTGTLTLTGSTTLEGLRFGNPLASGTVSSIYKGNGTLTINTSSTTPAAGLGLGSCVIFTQTSGTATFEVGGIYNFTAATGNTVFYAVPGSSQFTGTGTVTVNGAFRAIRAITYGAAFDTELTIGSGVTFDITTSILITFTGTVLLDRAAGTPNPGTNTKVSKITNSGTIKITGNSSNGIYIANSANDPGVLTFKNETTGTVSINGTFADNTTSLTLGGIVFAAAGTYGTAFDNYGTYNYNTTTAGTSPKPAFYSGTAPIYTLTNRLGANINIGANAPTFANAMTLGNTGAKVDNYGTITIEKGVIAAGGASPVIKNYGTFNFNLADAATASIGGNVTFQNLSNGRLKGQGAAAATATVSFATADSYIEPGQATGTTNRLNFYKTGAHTLVGIFNADINGPTAITEFDQVYYFNGDLTVNLTMNLNFGFTPTVLQKFKIVRTDGTYVGGTGTVGTITGPAGRSILARYLPASGEIEITDVVLTAELISFTATPLSKSNKLTWVTATESNNKGFDIQRQTQTGDWATIGFVAAKGKAATYTFEDNAPLSISYYRLRQVDLDGKETLSKVVSVNSDKKATAKVYPTLVKDIINVEFSGNNGATDVQIVNLLGQVVKVQKLQNTEGVTPMNISDLTTGSYIMRLVSKSGSESHRFEKQ